MNNYLKNMVLALSLIMLQNVIAQNKSAKKILTKKEKNNIISSIQTNLNTTYISELVSQKMINELKNNLNSKKYKEILDPLEFAQVLTKDLQSVSKDLHLKVRFEPKRIARKKHMISDKMQLEIEKRMAKQMAEINYGFTETKILNGNIGYLNLRMFADAKYAKEAATAAMNFLSNTNGIIIDLRNNGGGVSSMVQLLCSYFFDEKPVLLSNFYERQTDKKTQLYSFAHVDGKRSTNKHVYILTSKNTFSAAEAFTYTMKHLDKATVVGEITKGGANRTKRINLNDNFTISVPYIKSIHPITKTNWEGKGVQPLIKTSEKDAFVMAYIDAIDKTVKRNKSDVLNKIGYTFLQQKSINNAIYVFKENVKLFPNNANSWDSLGEAYFTNRDKENAIQCYHKALELDPNSETAKAMLQKLKNIK
jgi:tetratricopeptide (TPR) repeat protein